jgi:hypothetical protein
MTSTDLVAAFDYQAPEHIEHYTTLTLARDAIRKEMGRCAKSIIKIGLHLIDVKEECGHGLFLKWLAAEFGWSADTAQNFMRVAKVFSNAERVRFLEPTTLYLLAKPSTPEQVREEVLSSFDAGKKLQAEEVKALIKKAKGGPSKHKPPEPPRPVLKKPEEEDDHELKDWVATFESWSRDRQQIGLNFVASEESELRGLVDLKEMLIVELKKKIGQIEQENQSLRERLAAPQPEPAEPEPEEAPRPASEPSEPQAIEAIITWDRPAQIALFAMLHEHLNAIEPPAEQIERPEQQPVAPAEHAPPPPPPAAPAEPPPMKSREETIAAFEKSGRLGLGDWQQKLMHIDAAVVEALITEGLLAAENDDRVRIIQPWMMPAA